MLRIITPFIFLAISGGSYAQPYKNLVFKGGGIRGIAYAGALKVLEEKNVSGGIEKVAGTSVGAITGLLFSIGYSATEIEDILYDLDIATFNDGECFFIGGQKRIRKKYGWYKGEKLEEWAGELIKAKTGAEQTTFLQLHQLVQSDKRFKDLYITATNVSKQRIEVFSWETHPDMSLKTAVRASTSIPLYYGAVFIDSAGRSVQNMKATENYDVYVDGGLVANYAISIFNSDADNAAGRISAHTLGLKLERPEQLEYCKQNSGIAPYDIRSLKDYIAALYNLTIEQLNKGVPQAEEKKHTIYISTSNMNPRVRHISQKQKQLLFDNGVQGAKQFFEEKN